MSTVRTTRALVAGDWMSVEVVGNGVNVAAPEPLYFQEPMTFSRFLGLADCFRIARIILVRLHVGADVARAHQLYLVPKLQLDGEIFE